MQKAHFIVGRISGFQRSARNRNVRPPLVQTGRTRTASPPHPVPIRSFEPPKRTAGVEPSTLSTPIACEPKGLISKASTAGQDRIRSNVKDEPRRDLARLVPHLDSHSVVSFRISFGRTRRDSSRRWLWRLVGPYPSNAEGALHRRTNLRTSTLRAQSKRSSTSRANRQNQDCAVASPCSDPCVRNTQTYRRRGALHPITPDCVRTQSSHL